MIRNLCRPEAGDIAIVNIPLHWLAKSCGSAGGVDFPTRREDDGASHRNMDLGGPAGSLQCDDVFLLSGCLAFDAACFLINSPEMLHEAFLSEK